VKAWQAMGVPVSVLTENYPDGPYCKDEPIPGIYCVRIPTAARDVFWRLGPFARVARWTYHQLKDSRCASAIVAAYPECAISSKLAMPIRPVLYNCESVSDVVTNPVIVGKYQQTLVKRLADTFSPGRIRPCLPYVNKEVVGIWAKGNCTWDNIRAVGLVYNFQKIRAENFAQKGIGLILT